MKLRIEVALMGNPNCFMIIAGSFFLWPIAKGNSDILTHTLLLLHAIETT